jgi:hypothetical protein
VVDFSSYRYSDSASAELIPDLYVEM